MNSTTKVLIAIGASMAIGAALGVLYAPSEGGQTRKKVLRKGKKLASIVGDKLNEGRESLEEMRDMLQKQLSKVNGHIEQVTQS